MLTPITGLRLYKWVTLEELVMVGSTPALHWDKRMAEKTLQVPDDTFLPGAQDLGRMPYTMVGDAAFPLKPYLIRPYAGRRLPRPNAIFNYRLSRAGISIEKAFGILSSRWRIFYQPIQMKPGDGNVHTAQHATPWMMSAG